jgi:hypothetical protein
MRGGADGHVILSFNRFDPRGLDEIWQGFSKGVANGNNPDRLVLTEASE